MTECTIDYAVDSGTEYVPPYPPLAKVSKPTLTTREYSYYANIEQQTARVHACYGTGEVQPLRINGRLHWPTDAVKKLLGVSK